MTMNGERLVRFLPIALVLFVFIYNIECIFAKVMNVNRDGSKIPYAQ